MARATHVPRGNGSDFTYAFRTGKLEIESKGESEDRHKSHDRQEREPREVRERREHEIEASRYNLRRHVPRRRGRARVRPTTYRND